jgi:hypothetical protein
VISVVEEEQKLRSILPEIRTLFAGTIALLAAELV